MKTLLALIAVFFCCSIANGDLRQIDSALKTIKVLQDENIIMPEIGKMATDFYLSEATKLVGHKVTVEEISKLANGTTDVALSSVVWCFAAIVTAIAICWLGRIYLFAIWSHIPPVVYEMMCYGCVIYAFLSGNIWLMFPACFLFVGCLTLTKYLHIGIIGVNTKSEEFRFGPFTYGNIANLICFLVYGIVAWKYDNSLIGFLCIAAMFCFFVSNMVHPLCYIFGYCKNEYIPRMTAAAFIMLFMYVAIVDGLKTGHSTLLYAYRVFGDSVLFIGTFIYFCFLLVISSLHYGTFSKSKYLAMQVLAISSGIAAAYFGDLYNIGMLKGVSGTFLVLYFLEKYFEIPGVRLRAWSLLALSIGLYWLAGFITDHPEYFLLGLGK